MQLVYETSSDSVCLAMQALTSTYLALLLWHAYTLAPAWNPILLWLAVQLYLALQAWLRGGGLAGVTLLNSITLS